MVVLCNICASDFWFRRLMKWRCGLLSACPNHHFQWGGCTKCTKHVMLANVCDDTYDAAGQYSSIFDQLILNLNTRNASKDMTWLNLTYSISFHVGFAVWLPSHHYHSCNDAATCQGHRVRHLETYGGRGPSGTCGHFSTMLNNAWCL